MEGTLDIPFYQCAWNAFGKKLRCIHLDLITHESPISSMLLELPSNQIDDFRFTTTFEDHLFLTPTQIQPTFMLTRLVPFLERFKGNIKLLGTGMQDA